MSRPAGGIPAFTEHKHSKSPDLCMLILIYTNNDSNFIGGFAGCLKYRWTGLYPDPIGADSIHVSGCTPQLEFDTATSIATNGKSLYQKVYRLPLVKESFSLIIEMIEKYSNSDDDEWFLGFDKKGKSVYIKPCNVLIEPIAESKHKKKCTKTDNKVVHLEREEERSWGWNDGEKEVDKGKKQTGDEILLPKQSY